MNNLDAVPTKLVQLMDQMVKDVVSIHRTDVAKTTLTRLEDQTLKIVTANTHHMDVAPTTKRRPEDTRTLDADANTKNTVAVQIKLAQQKVKF